MPRVPHATQVDLRFGDAAGDFLHFRVGVRPDNFSRERLHLVGQNWIGIDRQAQGVAQRISRRV